MSSSIPPAAAASPLVPTTTNEAITHATTSYTLFAGLQNAILAGAKDVPILVAKLLPLAPDLQAQLQGKSALGSKTVWFGIFTPIISAIVARYGLGWNDELTGEVAGLLSWAVLLVLRFFTKAPITSVLPQKPPIGPIGGS